MLQLFIYFQYLDSNTSV